MKNYLLCAFLLSLSLPVHSSDGILEIKTKADLAEHIEKKVILVGTYHDPGKGSRFVRLAFGRLNIQDHSFYQKSKEGLLTTELKDGDRIQFEAKIAYFKGSKSLVQTHPVVQEARPPKQVIKGKEHYVYPPSYSIRDAKLIKIVKPEAESGR